VSERHENVQRDYSKFLNEDGSFNIRVMPRPEYTKMVNDYRRNEDVIREVFVELHWLWDLEQLEQAAVNAGDDVAVADLAQQVIDTMDDKEWWEVMGRFERHFNVHFSENTQRWSHILDPVYDDQEVKGWTRRQ
jgi:hypothetical protein